MSDDRIAPTPLRAHRPARRRPQRQLVLALGHATFVAILFVGLSACGGSSGHDRAERFGDVPTGGTGSLAEGDGIGPNGDIVLPVPGRSVSGEDVNLAQLTPTTRYSVSEPPKPDDVAATIIAGLSSDGETDAGVQSCIGDGIASIDVPALVEYANAGTGAGVPMIADSVDRCIGGAALTTMLAAGYVDQGPTKAQCMGQELAGNVKLGDLIRSNAVNGADGLPTRLQTFIRDAAAKCSVQLAVG